MTEIHKNSTFKNIKRNLSAFFSFKGRMSRSDFAVAVIGMLLVFGGLQGMASAGFLLSAENPNYSGFDEKTFFFALMMLFLSLILVILIAFIFKRLHDINLSGWWVLLIPLIIYYFPAFLAGLFSLPLFFYPGNKKNNKYGPDPLQKLPTKN